MPLLPVLHDYLLLFIQFLYFTANEKASDVIVVLRTAEGFETRKIFFYLQQLLFGRGTLMLIDFGCFFELHALLEVGLWIELFEYIEERLFADPPDCVMGIFWVFCEDTDVSGVFFSAALLVASVHFLMKELQLLYNPQFLHERKILKVRKLSKKGQNLYFSHQINKRLFRMSIIQVKQYGRQD